MLRGGVACSSTTFKLMSINGMEQTVQTAIHNLFTARICLIKRNKDLQVFVFSVSFMSFGDDYAGFLTSGVSGLWGGSKAGLFSSARSAAGPTGHR